MRSAARALCIQAPRLPPPPPSLRRACRCELLTGFPPYQATTAALLADAHRATTTAEILVGAAAKLQPATCAAASTAAPPPLASAPDTMAGDARAATGAGAAARDGAMLAALESMLAHDAQGRGACASWAELTAPAGWLAPSELLDAAALARNAAAAASAAGADAAAAGGAGLDEDEAAWAEAERDELLARGAKELDRWSEAFALFAGDAEVLPGRKASGECS